MQATHAASIEAKGFVAVLSDRPLPNEFLTAFDAWPRRVFSTDRRLFVAFAPRNCNPSVTNAPAGVADAPIRLLLGDATDFIGEQNNPPMGNGALVELDVEHNCVGVLSSVTGLPPVFLVDEPGNRIFASSLSDICSLRPSGVKFDAESVLDLFAYGFPNEHRTLFRNVRLLPGCTRLTATAGSPVQSRRAWTFDDEEPLRDWNAFVEMQIAAFLSVLRRIDLDNTFLSLTAGVDTRAIFAALVLAGRRFHAYTLTGESPSIDAQAARAICRSYGVPHETVTLDGEFRKRLPDYVVEASRLSGGVASLGQAHQVHFYRKLPGRYLGRLSGNLGNQLGRKGIEHVSTRAITVSVLPPHLRSGIAGRGRCAWVDHKLDDRIPSSPAFLFQREFPFTQLGNYSIGDSFVVQYTPYATRDLIALSHREPARSLDPQFRSLLSLRLRDLHHRFFGEPPAYSFQRRFIKRAGGFVASYPINWGWRAGGGIALTGMLRGCMAAVDAYTEREGWDIGRLGKVIDAMHIVGLHEHRRSQRWVRESLRDFMHDILLSKHTQEAGVIDVSCVRRMLDEHYTDRASHHGALVFALDLAVASRNFRASL